MESVVYILGAGFSAPLGLPVMSNFLPRSKDMFAKDPNEYAHFSNVFKMIQEMHVCKSYFDADLLNIEEILSILEMKEGLTDGNKVRSFTKYVSDVVAFHTPTPKAPEPFDAKVAGSWLNSIFNSNDGLWPYYGAFVAGLFNLSFQAQWGGSITPGSINFQATKKPNASYSVVSLNYDMVLENVCHFLNTYHGSARPVHFQTDFEHEAPTDKISIPLCKLHGSVDSGEIIAPTWNKSLHKHLRATWGKAHELISKANHIRFIGYSLPISDAYIRYLLKSAVVKCENLKSIDIICLGEDALRNYENFLTFKFRRRKLANITDFLVELLSASLDQSHFGDKREFDKIEKYHTRFMESRSIHQ